MTARIQHNTAQRRDVVNPPQPHWAVRTFSGFSPDKSGEVSPISRLCAARGNERIKLKLRLQLVAEDVWKVGWGVDRLYCHPATLYSTVQLYTPSTLPCSSPLDIVPLVLAPPHPSSLRTLCTDGKYKQKILKISSIVIRKKGKHYFESCNIF